MLPVSGCSESVTELEPNLESREEVVIDEETVKEIWYSPEYRRLAELRHQSLGFIKEALDRGVTKAELATALKSEIELSDLGDSRMNGTNVDDLIFANNREVAEHHRATITAAEQSLIEKYPVLLKLDHDDVSTRSGCIVKPDEVDWFLANHEAIYVSSQNSLSYGKTEEGWPPCGGWVNSLAFAGCMIMAGSFCGPTVGVFALCTWGCICTTCDDDFPAICGNGPF